MCGSGSVDVNMLHPYCSDVTKPVCLLIELTLARFGMTAPCQLNSLSTQWVLSWQLWQNRNHWFKQKPSSCGMGICRAIHKNKYVFYIQPISQVLENSIKRMNLGVKSLVSCSGVLGLFAVWPWLRRSWFAHRKTRFICLRLLLLSLTHFY